MSNAANLANTNRKKICANCSFWFSSLLQCRRRSPTDKYWPITGSTEWCGDWESADWESYYQIALDKQKPASE
jgi:hypothetical protein